MRVTSDSKIVLAGLEAGTATGVTLVAELLCRDSVDTVGEWPHLALAGKTGSGRTITARLSKACKTTEDGLWTPAGVLQIILKRDVNEEHTYLVDGICLQEYEVALLLYPFITVVDVSVGDSTRFAAELSRLPWEDVVRVVLGTPELLSKAQADNLEWVVYASSPHSCMRTPPPVPEAGGVGVELLESAKLAVEGYRRRCAEQGFYSEDARAADVLASLARIQAA